MSDSIELLSPLDRDTCVARLAAAVDSDWKPFGSHKFMGHVSAAKLRLRKRIGYRNSFQTYVTANLLPEGTRTRLTCSFSITLAVRVFFTVWFGAVGIALLAVMLGSGANRNLSLGALAPAGMLAFGYGLIRFGRWLARNERDALVAFLRETLDVPPA